MPELPEVETIRRGLNRRVAGRQIVGVVGGGRVLRHNPGGIADLQAFLVQQTIAPLQRRGKFMWMPLRGQDYCLVIHLGMSGQVIWHDATVEDPPFGRHERVRILLDDGSILSFNDQRMFGALTISLLQKDSLGYSFPKIAAHIGSDPLEANFAPELVAQKMCRSSRRIKTLLLDQQIVSGIGNIYADEALFRARIHGLCRGNELSSAQVVDLLEQAAQVMRESIAQGGTSFDELYVNAAGEPGYFARSLQAYGLADKPCVNCGQALQKVRVDGRSHYFCPTCQVESGKI